MGLGQNGARANGAGAPWRWGKKWERQNWQGQKVTEKVEKSWVPDQGSAPLQPPAFVVPETNP